MGDSCRGLGVQIKPFLIWSKGAERKTIRSIFCLLVGEAYGSMVMIKMPPRLTASFPLLSNRVN